MRLFHACSLLMVGAGCILGDPTLTYGVPNWKVVDGDGRWYEREIDGRVRISIHNSGFGGSFDVRVHVVNIGSEDLAFDGSPMYLADRRGSPLSADLVRFRGCEPGGSVRLAPGASLDVACGFTAHLPGMPRDIVAVQRGLALGGREIPLTIPMTTRAYD